MKRGSLSPIQMSSSMIVSFLSIFRVVCSEVYYISSGTITNETCIVTNGTRVAPCYSIQWLVYKNELLLDKSSITLYFLPGTSVLNDNQNLAISNTAKVQVASLNSQGGSLKCYKKSCIIFQDIKELEMLSLNFTSCQIIVSNTIKKLKTRAIILRCVFSMSTNYAVSFVKNRSALTNFNVSVYNCYFSFNNGAIAINFGPGGLPDINVVIDISNTVFLRNFRSGDGGTINVYMANLELQNSIFMNNSASTDGGAIYISDSGVIIKSTNFTENRAFGCGGAISLLDSRAEIINCTFASNTAGDSGGAICSQWTQTFDVYSSVFTENTAGSLGGAIYTPYVVMTDCLLKNNYAGHSGGAIHFYDDYGSPDVVNGDTQLTNTFFFNNEAKVNGGGICCDKPRNNGDIEFSNGYAFMNSAMYGGFLHVIGCSVSILKYDFIQNKAKCAGGAIFGNKSEVFKSQIPKVFLINNTAGVNGGAIFLVHSFVSIFMDGKLTFIHNTVVSAGGKGGAIYISDSNCESIFDTNQQCSLDYYDPKNEAIKHLLFYNNVADFGSILYGGLLDRCYHDDPELLGMTYFKQISLYDENALLAITSDPVRICYCLENQKPDCLERNKVIKRMRGDFVRFNITAVDQDRNPIPSIIRAYYEETTADLGEGEGRSRLNGTCSTLTYHIYTTDSSARLNLQPEGFCERSALSNLIIDFDILNCSRGLELNKDRCICDRRLTRYLNITTCYLDTLSVQKKNPVWFEYKNDLLKMATNCPMDFCKVTPDMISLTLPDEECANHRGGILCGACQLNYSIALGSSRCLPCTNRYSFIWLSILFAFAGVALVSVILVCNLTISQGTLNGFIFYANIISIGGLTNVQDCSIHPVLSVFIAWVNLDLGIETCFYPGMNTYQKTWLQFVFPLYIILLVLGILIASYYSTAAMKVFGRNNVAILATLFLLSYTKALKTIAASFSGTQVLISNADNVSAPVLPLRVWSYDGNMEYLKGNHVISFVVALGLLLFLFLPFTLLLTFGQFLRSLQVRRMWMSKITHSIAFISIMDAYHAPYNRKHRYWTGLLLLMRCILFLAFAMVYTGDELVVNSYVIVMAISGILLIKTCSTKVYRSFWKNALELIFLYNLEVLGATLYFLKGISPGDMNAAICRSINGSISINFIIFIGILVYHTHLRLENTSKYKYVKQVLWSKISNKNTEISSIDGEKEESKLLLPTTSHVELREELLTPN